MRPTALLLPAVVALSDLLGRPQRLQTVGRLAVAGLAMLACIAPWTLRNYRVFDALVPISTNGGVNFWMGNNPETTGGYQGPRPSEDFGGEPQRDAALKNEALAYIRATPLTFAGRTLTKAVRLHERESIGVGWNEPGLTHAAAALAGRLGLPPEPCVARAVFGIKLVSNLWWWAVLAVALLGLLRLATSGRPLMALLGPPTLLWAYFTAVHAATVIQDRYHFAAVPMIAMLAGAGLPRRPVRQVS